ncbi:MAG: DVUA0089 family protein [Emcibacter sp.]|nr:DVUA0089 family protein [Emcibacter sp.]
MIKGIYTAITGSIFTTVMLTNIASASIVDAEGMAGTGLNDNITSAMNVGNLVGNGFFFDIDCANDCDATADDDNGLDTQLWIFNTDGILISWNDDSDFFSIGSSNAGTDPGSDIYGDYDSFIGEIFLNNGTYYVAVSAYNKDANAITQPNYIASSDTFSKSGEDVSGVTADDSFSPHSNTNNTNPLLCGDLPSDQCSGAYQLQIRTSFTDYMGQLTIDGWVGTGTNGNDVDFYKFTVENTRQTVAEPATLGLLGLGLLGLGMVRRRRK